ncbi:MAG: hypothetical protein JNL82_29815 [Myxococcales bacterium]|nr:hypothetical protein [Myxococcales bacterium]
MKLQQQLQAVRDEIADVHATQDPSRMEIALRLAGLQVRRWDLESLLAEDITAQLGCTRQAATWSEQVVRAAKAMQVDLLRDLFAKAEAMQKHQGSLRDLK